MLKKLGAERGSVPVSKPISIVLDKDTKEDIDHNTSIFSVHALICRFRGFWPSLLKLHEWISRHWEPLLAGTVHIYPMAKGFLIAKFEEVDDINEVV